MKVYIKLGLLITGILALSSFVMSAFLVSELLSDGPINPDKMVMQYHFALYLPQSRTSSNSEIIKGAQKAAADQNAALTVHFLDMAGIELNMSQYLGLDGIILCPNLDDAITLQKMENLRSLDIPLVLINHNIASEQPWPFIGTNNFDLGKKAGSLIGKTPSLNLHIAVVYSEKSPAIYAERELVEMGINGTLSGRLGSPLLTEKTDLNPRDAEKIVYQLVRTYPSLTTIMFTDTNDTLAGTQALIDLNMVGRIQIIGFGSVPAINEYIQKGIIVGSLVVNPELIGYQSVSSLAELIETGYTSTSVDTGIDIITRKAE